MPRQQGPSVLLTYPSMFYYPESMHSDEVKASQLVLASYLAQFFPVEYMDLEVSIGRPTSAVQIKRFERRVHEILQRDFDVLAISCWTSLCYKAAMSVARIARELHPDRLIVVGGYHPTARPDDFVTADNLFDYVVRGEGELALRDIVQSFSTQGRPAATTTVIGPTVYPEQFPAVDWDIIDGLMKTEVPGQMNTLTIYLSRGCPFECSFCMESLKDHCWRPLSPSVAVTQIREVIRRYNPAAVGLGDACFGVRPEWRKEFLSRLADLHPTCYILFETRPEFLDHDDIEVLSGLKAEVQFGVESCSPMMLRIMNKSKQPEKFLDKFRQVSHLLSEREVVHGANLIFNHPGETQRTLEETFDFVDAELDRGPSSLIWTCHGYMHFPGSAVDREQAYFQKECGTQFLCGDWWYKDEDPFVSSRQVIPSSDLSGERVSLWREMFQERDARLRDALIPEAFRMAAATLYSNWMNDPRYTAPQVASFSNPVGSENITGFPSA
ncbi:MAG: radical SAM protein [Candidatus Zixiibacteriota bacterium]